MFEVNNKDTRPTSIGVFIVNFEHISQLVLVFLLTLSKQMPTGYNSCLGINIIDFIVETNPTMKVLHFRCTIDLS